MKVQKIISLDKETAELAKTKTNFSGWVRDQLRSERNKREQYKDLDMEDAHEAMRYRNQNKINRYDALDTTLQRAEINSRELLWHLEQRTDEEVKALVALLKHIK